MGHDGDVLIEVETGQAVDATLDARFELVQTLATWGRPLGVSASPSLCLAGVLDLKFGPSEAFKGAKVTLTQAHLDVVRERGLVRGGQKMSRFMCSFEVAGVDTGQGLVLQRLPQLGGLPNPKCVQSDVDVSLDACLDIPVGLAMSNECDAG